MYRVRKFRKAFPGRFREIAARMGCVDGFFDEFHRRDVARTVREDHVRRYAHDQLRANRLREQWIIGPNGGGSIDAEPPRFLEIDEEEADFGIDIDVAEA